MSLLHLDFPSGQTGLYGTTTSYMLDGFYAQADNINIVEDPDPTTTGNVIQFSGGFLSSGTVRRTLPSAKTTLGFACRVWLPGLPSSTDALPNPIILRDAGNASICSVRINTDGSISAYRGDAESGTLLGTSSPSVAVSNAWQHYEIKIVLSATVGTVEVRIEGVTVLNLTGQNTGTGPCTQYVMRTNHTSGSSFFTYYMKDIAVWDDAGTLNNDFMGSISVYELLTNSDVSFNWAASTGTTGWDLIDESPPNDDTDYIYAVDPPPAASKFGLTNLPADVTSVRGLIAIARSKKTDGGDGNLQVGMVSGASTDLGSDRPITTAYTYWQDVFETDPATGVAWTPTAVDAANIQLDRTV